MTSQDKIKLFMPNFVFLGDLKEGDKFYYLDGLIYIMIECKVVASNQIDFVARLLGTRDIVKMSIHSDNVLSTHVFRYTRRDKPSFNNGFKLAIEYCMQYMNSVQIANAHLDTDISIHIKMNELYNKWKSTN